MRKCCIAWTGGGTAGHVLPNVPLIEAYNARQYHLIYLGQAQSIEQTLLASLPVKFLSIRSGKLRRYFSFKTLVEPFNILIGIGQALYYLSRYRPVLVFSKGGFVAFPVVVAAWLLRIPTWVHESDVTPGLANRLCFPLAKQIFLAFDARPSMIFRSERAIISGLPIRAKLYQGDRRVAKTLFPFTWKKPVLLFIGGSLGSKLLNTYVWCHLSELCQCFHVIHVCGQIDTRVRPKHEDYYSVDYLEASLPHVLAIADLVVSRAGANTIFELLVLGKPCVLVPLSAQVSRGEQLANALYCHEHYGTVVVEEAELDAKLFIILQQYDLSQPMQARSWLDGTEIIMNQMDRYLGSYE